MRKIIKKPAIAFDATGVIYRGREALPGAKEAFQKLMDHKIPYCVLTNASGTTEGQRAKTFNSQVGIQAFNNKNTIQACTPMKQIIKDNMKKDIEQKDSIALVTGYPKVHKLFDKKQQYLKHKMKYLTVAEMSMLFPALVPLTQKAEQFTVPIEKVKQRVLKRFGALGANDSFFKEILDTKKIDQIYVISNMYNYEANLQIISDILGFGGYTKLPGEDDEAYRFRQKLKEQPKDVQIYMSADDMLIPSAAATGLAPRQTLGTFVHVLNSMMKEQFYGYDHPNISYTITGKPSKYAFNYAREVLKDQVNDENEKSQKDEIEISDFYMVGDSPEIDIKGGKNNGFKTVLVESGLYQPNTIDSAKQGTHNNNSDLTQYLKYADHIVPDVLGTVDRIIEISKQ